MSIEFNLYNAYGVNDDKNQLLSSYEIKDLLKPQSTPPPVNYFHYPEFWRELDDNE